MPSQRGFLVLLFLLRLYLLSSCLMIIIILAADDRLPLIGATGTTTTTTTTTRDINSNRKNLITASKMMMINNNHDDDDDHVKYINNYNHNTNGEQVDSLVQATEGHDLDLSCPIEQPNEDMIISWICDDEPANIRSSRIHVTDTGKLRIKAAKLGDTCNYRCEAADGLATISVIIRVVIVEKQQQHQSRQQQQQMKLNQHRQQQQQQAISNKQELEQLLLISNATSSTNSSSSIYRARHDHKSNHNNHNNLNQRHHAQSLATTSTTSKPSLVSYRGPEESPLAVAGATGNQGLPLAPRATSAPAASDATMNDSRMSAATTTTSSSSTMTSGPTTTTTTKRVKSGTQSQSQSQSQNQKSEPGEDQASPEDSLSIQLEPRQILVARNSSFNLECKVEHPAQQRMGPQIVWLKELLGSRPQSMREAHEQNLLLIDNVYYQSLNWARMISYDKRSTSTSSALLVRHASQVHSGRYICFAGFPQTLMLVSANLNLTLGPNYVQVSSSPASSSQQQLTTTTTTQSQTQTGSEPATPSSLDYFGENNNSIRTRTKLRYKMVMARVQVSDVPTSGVADNNPHSHSHLNSNSLEQKQAKISSQSNFILAWFLNLNPWLQAITCLTILVSFLWLVGKLIAILGFIIDCRRGRGRAAGSLPHDSMMGQQRQQHQQQHQQQSMWTWLVAAFGVSQPASSKLESNNHQTSVFCRPPPEVTAAAPATPGQSPQAPTRAPLLASVGSSSSSSSKNNQQYQQQHQNNRNNLEQQATRSLVPIEPDTQHHSDVRCRAFDGSGSGGDDDDRHDDDYDVKTSPLQTTVNKSLARLLNPSALGFRQRQKASSSSAAAAGAMPAESGTTSAAGLVDRTDSSSSCCCCPERPAPLMMAPVAPSADQESQVAPSDHIYVEIDQRQLLNGPINSGPHRTHPGGIQANELVSLNPRR